MLAIDDLSASEQNRAGLHSVCHRVHSTFRLDSKGPFRGYLGTRVVSIIADMHNVWCVSSFNHLDTMSEILASQAFELN